MTKEIRNTINQIKKNIKKYNPQKIILFGSQAWGRPGKNSDFDLFIIKNTKKRFLKSSVGWFEYSKPNNFVEQDSILQK